MGLGDGDGVAQLPVPAGFSFAGHAGEGQVAGGRRVGVTYNTMVGSLRVTFYFSTIVILPTAPLPLYKKIYIVIL